MQIPCVSLNLSIPSTIIKQAVEQEMNGYFPKWLNPRLFIVALILSSIPAIKNAIDGGLTSELIVFAVAQTGFGGIFWGVIFTLIQKLIKRS